jgi:hypothetical protein
MASKKTVKVMVVTTALWVAVLWAIASSTRVSACPLCSESLPNTSAPGQSSSSQAGDASAGQPPRQGHLAEGFYYSIMFMLAMPYLIVGGLGGMLYFKLKNAGIPAPAATESQVEINPS